jgi:hypothetical protein
VIVAKSINDKGVFIEALPSGGTQQRMITYGDAAILPRIP